MKLGRPLRPMGAVLLAAACAPQPQTVPFRSLESSGTAAFVCYSLRDGDTTFTNSRNIEDCPDTNPVDGETRLTYALVTQPRRGEVAVLGVNVADTTSGKLITGGVVDMEPAVPGFNFLPVGADPVDIVASPGSQASFVATAEVGREAIYALPWGCTRARDANGPIRDISLWPACHLPSAPGKMTMLMDPPAADGSIRMTCKGELEDDASKALTKAAQDGSSCGPARLDEEQGPAGRRKLLVSLPDRGELVLIDAQWLLDQKQGSFGQCNIEKTYPLGKDLPNVPVFQKLPPDLAGTFPNGFPYPPQQVDGSPRPAGFARLDDSNEHTLFVADSELPLIHRLNTADPCAIKEVPPLLPAAYSNNTSTVTATKLAVMDHLTSDGKRYLYAIDQVGGGQVMIFDVSPGSANRTPLVRERSSFIPFEVPDRLALSAPAVDVAFISQHNESSPDPATGVETLRQQCDPTPKSESPGVLFRPTLPDYSTGARPSELRGTFGVVALSSGFLAVIDVEDLDKPCRRPKEKNRDTVENFRGCAPDNLPFDAFTTDGNPDSTPTVTDEESCQIVERHRARGANLMLTDATRGPRAPSVRVAPRLVDKDGRGLLVDDTDEGRQHPKMLGVNFRNFDDAHPENRAQVFIGTDLFEAKIGDTLPPHELVINPAEAKQNSLVLSFAEPRAYGSDVEDLAATYEGKLLNKPAGVITKATQTKNGIDTNVWLLRDTSGFFCDAGVQSSALLTRSANLGEVNYGNALNVKPEDFDAFAREYADQVTITSSLLPETDGYWQSPNRGAKCNGANANQPGAGFIQCRVLFGTPDAPADARTFWIQDASRDTLSLTPKYVTPKDALDATAAEARLEALGCCFPEPVSYTVRVSKQWLITGAPILHPIVTGPSPDFECQVDPNSLYSQYQTRAYEVACDDQNSPNCLQQPTEQGGQPRPIIGPSAYFDDQMPPQATVLQARACLIKNPRTDLQTIGRATYPGCMFTTYQSNFVIYRGTQPSEQDMQFQWTVIGGFTPEVINLSVGNDPNTSPQTLLRSPFSGTVMLTDGGDKGLVIVDLTSFAPYSIN